MPSIIFHDNWPVRQVLGFAGTLNAQHFAVDQDVYQVDGHIITTRVISSDRLEISIPTSPELERKMCRMLVYRGGEVPKERVITIWMKHHWQDAVILDKQRRSGQWGSVVNVYVIDRHYDLIEVEFSTVCGLTRLDRQQPVWWMSPIATSWLKRSEQMRDILVDTLGRDLGTLAFEYNMKGAPRRLLITAQGIRDFSGDDGGSGNIVQFDLIPSVCFPSGG